MENTISGGMILPTLLFLLCLALFAPMTFYISSTISKISLDPPESAETLVSVMSLENSPNKAHR